ncbi:MAG TPA: DNA recombination protein RmuC [Vitreimonas sp.]|uniref:DNA recombination protein RmuC n=1 Tax=Vitreimonas sp. TaxID=3069702 RepID=UPI002D52264F|nr:DNA recombination protein RmuC [Vitreimonas sp.]HYD87016.1 DNA recombination protein RmuC [Vitreimonas sp.]
MTESLLLVLALAAIGAAAWFAYRSAGVEPIRAERDRLRAELHEARKQNLDLATELAAAKAQKNERSETEEARFVEIATRALQASQASFMTLANETFEKHKQAAAGGVKEVLTPAQEALAKLATSVEALEKARLQDKSAINEQVKQIVDAVGTTNKTTTQLLSALRASPKMRGRWGEQTLRNVLELSGLSAHVDFKEQFSTTDGEGARLRPDVVINLPGGRCIVVDSKVALSGYLDAVEATDDATRELHLKKHVAELKGHVKNLASKEYQKHVPDTAEFVVLFVPGENFLAAAAERDPNLFDDAFSQKVILTTPTTMVALAKSIAYGWRQEDSAKNTQKIAELGREMHSRMAIMVDKMAKVGDSIEKSVKSYNELVGSVESRVLPQARKFKELGAGDAGIEIAAAAQIEAAPRQLQPPEQLELMPPSQGTKRGR